jgi:hypothetical protein
MTSQEGLQKFIQYFNSFIPALHRQNRGPFQTVLSKLNNGLAKAETAGTMETPASLDTPMKSNFEVDLKAVKAGKIGISLYNLLYSAIGALKKTDSSESAQDVLTFDRRLDNVLANAFESIKESKPNISYEDLVTIVLFVNSYNPKGLKQRSGYDVEADLKEALGGEVSRVLNMSLTQIESLIGAMHLSSYTNYTGYDKLLMLNKSTGGVLITDAPKTIAEAIRICNNPNVKVEASVDNPQGKTVVGFTAMISYEK